MNTEEKSESKETLSDVQGNFMSTSSSEDIEKSSQRSTPSVPLPRPPVVEIPKDGDIVVSNNEGDRNISNQNANIRSGTKPHSLLSEEETEHRICTEIEASFESQESETEKDKHKFRSVYPMSSQSEESLGPKYNNKDFFKNRSIDGPPQFSSVSDEDSDSGSNYGTSSIARSSSEYILTCVTENTAESDLCESTVSDVSADETEVAKVRKHWKLPARFTLDVTWEEWQTICPSRSDSHLRQGWTQ